MGGEHVSPGIYEQIITERLNRYLGQLPKDAVRIEEIEPAQLPDRLSLLVSKLVKHALIDLDDEQRLEYGPRIVNQVARDLMERAESVDLSDLVIEPARELYSVGRQLPDGTWRHHARPLTPVADTTLLTGARGEPNLLAQLRSEIPSADRIDILVAFIRQTGIRPLQALLREHVASGKSLRVLTTTYTGSTERKALDLLSDLGADIRVSYDVSGTRLHAKSWLFGRDSGLSTAYVGSSNLTHQAQVTGLEWNIRLSEQRNPESVAKLEAVFESYWAGGDFSSYSADEFEERCTRTVLAGGPEFVTFDLHPFPFQRRMLEQLSMCRSNGQHKNLVVSATGTGKTILSAFDYKELRRQLPTSRLLFVAHRQEILEQTLATFRHVLRDPTFGELWVGGRRPRNFNHVFASIQSLSVGRHDLSVLELFDVVIVDEFHHAAAKTYRTLLDAIKPVELLGLTATPERTDGESVLHWFDERIAVELRLWDAIEQQRLAPFIYFGLNDDSDLSAIPRRGREYDLESLGLAYQADARWMANVLRETRRLVPDMQTMTGLGFCASVSHAEFTAQSFTKAGIPSASLSGQTSQAERKRRLAQLASGELRMVFSVDVLSEGIDLPDVNTILLLRPTESATVFLQQLGRGLRKSETKDACLVLDFIGAQATDFRFDLRYRAILGGSRTELERSIREGFPYLPAGCQINLDHITSERVLNSLRRAIPTSLRHQLRELSSLKNQSDPDLENFLEETGLDLSDVFRNDRSWMTLRMGAGLPAPQEGRFTPQFRRAMSRMLHIDDESRLSAYTQWLGERKPPTPQSEHDYRLLRMLLATLTRSIKVLASGSIQAAAQALWDDDQARSDLNSLFKVLKVQAARRGYPVVPLLSASNMPLRIHSRYSRDEILCALGCKPSTVRPPNWQTGVWFDEASSTDLLPFTLDKSGKTFSPSTRFRDYAISDTLIHWESQAATREGSKTGQRYIHHKEKASRVFLFARETVGRPFWFLGPAEYVSHEGERPMSITWKLLTPLPNDLFGMMAAAA